MIERKWIDRVANFLTNGQGNGNFTVADTSGFKVKQQVQISSTTQPTLYLEIKRIAGTTISVGPIDANISARTDISAYLVADTARIYAPEQARPNININQFMRATYEEEPAVAIRVIQVDKDGNIIGVGGLASNVNVHDGLGNVINSILLGAARYLNVNALITDGTDNLAINADGSINVNVTSGSAGTPVVHKEFNTFTDTAETTVATFTSTVANTYIQKLMGDAETLGTWKIYKNAISNVNLLATTRTSEVERNAIIEFKQLEKLAIIGDIIYITFQADRYRSQRLGISGATFVRLEGYY